MSNVFAALSPVLRQNTQYNPESKAFIDSVIKAMLKGAGGYKLPPLVTPVQEPVNMTTPTPVQEVSGYTHITPIQEQTGGKLITPPVVNEGYTHVTPPAGESIQEIANKPFVTYVSAADSEEGTFEPLFDPGKPRKEISDIEANINVDAFKPVAGEGSGVLSVNYLSKILTHPELFERHPYLADIMTTARLGGENTNSGEYAPRINREDEGLFDLEPEIKVSAPNREDLRRTLLHEIQHAIQQQEGWARGGSPSEMTTKESLMPVDRPVAMIHLGIKPNDMIYTKEGAGFRKEMIDAFPVGEQMYIKSPVRAYNRLAGEIEARDTANRANLTQAERLRTSPYAGEGIAVSDMIVKQSSGKSLSAGDFQKEINKAIVDTKENHKIDIGLASDYLVKKVKRDIGRDITGFVHEIDGDGMRHALNRHGNDEAPITEKDFLLIPKIIKSADNIEYTKTRRGQDSIKYKKRFKDYIYYVEEIRGVKETLTIKTMYKKKASRNRG